MPTLELQAWQRGSGSSLRAAQCSQSQPHREACEWLLLPEGSAAVSQLSFIPSGSYRTARKALSSPTYELPRKFLLCLSL